MSTLSQMLFAISNSLLVPVVLLLLVFLALAILLLGGFVREVFERRRIVQAFGEARALALKGAERATIFAALASAGAGVPARFLAEVPPGVPDDPAVFGQAVSAVGHAVEAKLARLAFLTRFGPMLGLMGTLIPLGPILVGLSSGDVKESMENLIIAFATTVVGVLIGGVTYGIALARRTWYGADLDVLEFVTGRLVPGAKGGAR